MPLNPRSLIIGAALALLARAAALDSTVNFNEVMYHPAGANDPEWIELRNQMAINMDLSGWTLTGGVNYTFPEGTIVAAGGYLLVSSNPSALQASAGVSGVFGPWAGALNNGGEAVRLRDRAQRLMDELAYGDGNGWPEGPDGSGFSLSRRNGPLSGTEPGHWTTSRVRGGTPGADNSGLRLGPAEAIFDVSAPWLYNDTSPGLSSGWASSAFTAGVGGWLSGNGALAREDAVLPAAVGTVLSDPATHPTGTYYFQKQFSFSGDPAATQLKLRTLLDDGAVIYLNGQEVARPKMSAGAVTPVTASEAEVVDAAFEEITLPTTALSNGTNTLSVEVHPAGRPIGTAGGNGGLTLTGLTLDEIGGPMFSTNYSRQAGAVAFARDLLGNGAYAPTHTIPNLNNGTFGNPSSWIGNSANSFCGISFGATAVNIGRVAWGRDNTGTYFDRTTGQYILEYTTLPNPGAATPTTGNPSTGWTILGTATYPANALPLSLRHAFSFSPVNATGIRLTVPGNGLTSGTCVDELEAGPPAPPPPPAFKLMSSGGAMDPSKDEALTGTAFAKDVIAGYPAHSIPHLNDGLTGNTFSWIGATPSSFCGISFSSPRAIARIAFARDNTGLYTDRTLGAYTVQYTTSANPSAATPDNAWIQIGSIVIDDAIRSPSRRHLFEFSSVNATGIRLLTPNGACIDELELYGPVPPDVTWGASLEKRQIILPPPQSPLRISEIAGTNTATWRVELQNSGASPLQIGGYVIAFSGAPAGGYTIPAQTLAPGAFLVLDQTALGFRPQSGDRIYVFGPGGDSFVDAAPARVTTRARSAGGDWLIPAADTFGTTNTFNLTTNIVINEIMYDAPDGPNVSGDLARDNPEEWVEIYNRGNTAVNLSGWSFTQGITYTFPAGTILAPGGYLVVANDAMALTAKWPEHTVRILGNFTGGLSNGGERLVLSDSVGNPADIVTYLTGGSWPSLPDNDGSSLELRDPFANRNHGASWAASKEDADTPWENVAYTMVAGQTFGQGPIWNEFRIGMLDTGECLMDDLSVVRVSDGFQMIQGGDFSSLTTKWRMLGNHGTSAVTAEPGNPGNSVLHVKASGSFGWNHNHIETTFVANTPVTNGETYEVSFRARWLGGSHHLNTRAYFSRLATTTELKVPSQIGTPGAPNSIGVVNVGPSLTALTHSPALPTSFEPVTVRVTAEDPDNVTSVSLRYAINGSASFASLPMTAAGSSYSAQIPAQAHGTIVHIYAEATDGAGSTSQIPARGPAARALYVVDDAPAGPIPAHELRLIMLPADGTELLTPINRLSDARVGGTVVSRRSEVFYDVGVRLQGTAAGRIRDGEAYVGYDIAFPRDQLFRGVHDSVNIDRSGRAPVVRGQDEIYVKHLFHRAGIPCTYDDLVSFVAPNAVHTGSAIMQLAGYERVFLDSQFDGDGTIFSMDGTYEPSTTVDGQPESLKNPIPLAVQIQSDFTNFGSDKEQYRPQLEPRAGRRKDDFTGLISFCQTMALPDPELGAAIGSRMDVDEWMHVTAIYALWGIADCYMTGGFAHNLRVHVPSSGQPVRALPWDMDFVLSAAPSSPPILATGNLLRVLNNAPGARHAYFGHLHHLCSTSFSSGYFQPWLQHYGNVVGQDMTGAAGYIDARRASILAQLPAQVPFSITTNGGADFTADDDRVLLSGNGWINVREIRRADTNTPLVLKWLSETAWEAEVSLNFGANVLVLNAHDFAGAQIASDSITVTCSVQTPNPRDHLRITELHYHPAPPSTPSENDASSDPEDFEFIELKNFSTDFLDIGDCYFNAGVEFTFPPDTILPPGDRILVVRKITAFQIRYGQNLAVAGEYGSNWALSNSGETVTLRDATGAIIQSFSYSDGSAWPQIADGDGHSLVPVAPSVTMDRSDPASWRASVFPAGNPGEDDTVTFVGSPTADVDRDGLNAFLEHVLGSSDSVPNRPDLRLELEPGGTALISFTVRANADDVGLKIEGGAVLPSLTSINGSLVASTQAGDRVTQTWRISVPAGVKNYFTRLKATQR